MAKRPRTVEQPIRRSEVLAPAPGVTPVYTLVLSDDDVEKLAAGRVSKDLMEQAYWFLGWKREGEQDWSHFRAEDQAS